MKMDIALTPSNGRVVTADEAQASLDAMTGYSAELFLRESGFHVTLTHTEALPTAKIDAFLVVSDGGYPFLLAFTRGGFGVNLALNRYIAVNLERDLRNERHVEVSESAPDGQRSYRVELLHSLD